MMRHTVTDLAKIGKYEVFEQAGKGSFGVVYKGRDPFIKREVAIKVCTVEDEEFRKRFFREAEIAGKLQHRNIVTVFAFGFEGEAPYLVQEFLTGKDLRQLIRERAALPLADKIDILIQVGEGLIHAHSQGVTHRDIKPANVRRLEDGTVKILDFGIAKLAGAETRLTQAGMTLGTATYLSPEQVRGGEVDPRADQFSFGVLAYELLTYRRPFQGNTLSALVYQILYKPPTPMDRVWSGCPVPLAKIVDRCLEKEPERRFRDAAELVAALRDVYQEITAGKWPAASAPPIPAEEGAPDPDQATASLQVAPSHTVRVDVVPEPPREPRKDAAGGDVTQPIPVLALGQEAPTPSEAAQPEKEQSADLSLTAQEISELVAQGDLEAARQQLEATIEQQAGPRQAGPGSGAPPTAPPAGPAAPVPGARATPAPAGVRPGGSLSARLAGLPPALRWGLPAALPLAVLLLILVPLLSRDPEPVVESPVVAPPPPPPEAAAPEPVRHPVTVDAVPWARITEIVRLDDGSLHDLPGDFHTPAALELEEGRYRISLENPDHPEADVTFCDVEVGPGTPAAAGGESELAEGPAPAGSATCRRVFRDASALDYFKDSGWWR